MRLLIPYERAKKAARRLKCAACDRGRLLHLTRAQEAVAHMLGYKHWHEFRLVALAQTAISLHDDNLTPDLLAARRRYQAKRLAELLEDPLEFATQLVTAAPPTGRQPPKMAVPGMTGAALIETIERRLDARLGIVPVDEPASRRLS